MGIGAHHVECIDEVGPTPMAADGRSEQGGRELFPSGHEGILGARCEVLQHADGSTEITVANEREVDGLEQGTPGPACGPGCARGTPVLVAQRIGDGERLAFTALQSEAGTGEQLIGDASEGGCHDDEGTAMGGDTDGGAGDGGAISQRGTAELPDGQTGSRGRGHDAL